MPRRIAHWIAATALGLALAGPLAPGAPSVYAVDEVVTSTNESGDSLRAAISAANANSSITRIVLPGAGPYVLGTCGSFEESNATGDLDITRSAPLTIIGTGQQAIIEQGCGDDRVLDIRGNGAVRLENVHIRFGDLPDRSIFDPRPANEFDGGGIRVLLADLTLVDAAVRNNVASDGNAGNAGFSPARPGGNGGGIWSGGGDVTITSSTIRDNSAGDGGDGDGIGAQAGVGGDGGGIFSQGGTVTIDGLSNVSRNIAGRGGDDTDQAVGGRGGDGGGIWSGGPVIVDGSNLEQNSAGAGGDGHDDPFSGGDGGDGGHGGAIFGGASSLVTITNSSLNQNLAGDGGTSRIGNGGDGGDGGAVHAPQLIGDGAQFKTNGAGDGGDSDNNSGGHGGDGGAFAGSSAVLTSGFVERNNAGRGGSVGSGGLGGQGGDGGAFAGTDAVTLIDTTVIRNSAGNGGSASAGGFGGRGGAIAPYFVSSTPSPFFVVTQSTFTGNAAGEAGTGSPAGSSGFGGWGGAIYNDANANGSTSATNSTFNDNTAGGSAAGAAKRGSGAAIAANNITMRYSTVAENGVGAAIDNAQTGLPSFDRFTANVIGSNAGGNCDLAANQSGGYNREAGGNTCGFNLSTDRVNQASTGLDPVDDSAFRERFVPTADGPLDGFIPPAQCSVGFLDGLVTDQDGVERPQGEGCEPGAVEIVGLIPIGSELDQAARFVPLDPVRLFDTRPAEAAPGPKGRLTAGQTIEVQVGGEFGVPTSAIAVVMNVTATQTDGPSFVTAFPTGTTRPTASNINIVTSGQTRPNLVTVPLGDGGRVSLFSLRAAHLLGDLAGYYVDQDAPVAAGRFVPLTPQRVFDTRPGEPAPGPKGKLTGGQTIDVQISGVAGVPSASQVAAVVINLTGTQASAPGFLTAFPKGSTRPTASNVNLSTAGATAPNLAIVPLGTDGQISIFSSHGAHALGDVAGYITSSGGTSSIAGLYVPLDPIRVFDTRPGESAAGPKGFVAAGAEVDAVVAGAVGIPTDAAAVVLNVTGTQSPLGFLTAYPDGVTRPLASTLNFAGTNDTRANAAMLPIGSGGRISFFTLRGSHVLADTAGYFLGAT